MIYQQTPLSFEQLFGLSLKYYWRVLVNIFWLIPIFVLIIAGFHYLPHLKDSLNDLFIFLICLISIFLFVVAIVRTDALLRQQSLSYAQALELSGKKILLIYAVFILYSISACVWFFIGHWLIFSLLNLQGSIGGLLALIVIGLPLIFLLIYFYLAVPILALYKQTIWKALYNSARYVRRQFLAMICLYAEAVLMMFIASGDSRHGQWLLTHHLLELADLIIFCLIIPFLIIQTLLIINNARLLEQESKVTLQK